jgi:hypothetical protein
MREMTDDEIATINERLRALGKRLVVLWRYQATHSSARLLIFGEPRTYAFMSLCSRIEATPALETALQLTREGDGVRLTGEHLAIVGRKFAFHTPNTQPDRIAGMRAIAEIAKRAPGTATLATIEQIATLLADYETDRSDEAIALITEVARSIGSDELITLTKTWFRRSD